MYVAAVLFARMEPVWWVFAGVLFLDFWLTTPIYSVHQHDHEHGDEDEAAEELKGRKADKRLVS